MSTPVFILLFCLMVCSGVLTVNLTGHAKWLYYYWNLDNEDDIPPSKLDLLRSSIAFYTACVVLRGLSLASPFVWVSAAARASMRSSGGGNLTAETHERAWGFYALNMIRGRALLELNEMESRHRQPRSRQHCKSLIAAGPGRDLALPRDSHPSRLGCRSACPARQAHHAGPCNTL